QLGWQLWGALPSELKADRGWIEIAVGTERLIDMPWECLRADGVPLSGPDVRLTRSVPMRYRIPPKTAAPIRVLLVVTNPKDERLLDAQREMDALAPASVPGYIVYPNPEPTLAALREALEVWQ